MLGWVMGMVSFFQTKSLNACVTYVFIYVVMQMSCLPLTPLEIFTGFCFGVPLGIFIDIIGRLSGAVASFLIARGLSKLNAQECCSSVKSAAVLRGVGTAVEEQGLKFPSLFI